MENTTDQIDPQKLLFSGGSSLGESGTSGVVNGSSVTLNESPVVSVTSGVVGGSSVTLNEFLVVTDICNRNQQKKFIITAKSWTTAGRPFNISAQIAKNQWFILTYLLRV